MIGRLCIFLTLCLMWGCAGPQKPYGPDPVDFSYREGGGEHWLSEARGQPVFLVLMRTSEMSSEIHLTQVKEAFAAIGKKIPFLVLSIAPNEEPMLEYFAEFHELPFSLGMAHYDVAEGKTGLGLVPVVPSSYFIDRNGRVVELLPGVTAAERIISLIEMQKW